MRCEFYVTMDCQPCSSLQDVFRAVIIANSHTSAPAWSWSGLCSAEDHARLDAFLRRSKRYGYCADNVPMIADLYVAADQSLFKRMLNNEQLVACLLQTLLPDRINVSYN